MDFQPTKCQASGLIEATRLLQEDDCKAMILTGAAGTGKTAMTKWIIDQATEEGYATQLLSFTVSATTNIRNKVMKPASTIHAYIYDIENIDGKEVCRRKEIIHRDKCLYIIDEASLIPGVRSKNGWQTPGSILEDLIDHCQTESSKGKLLFVGDTNQLPPVNESESRALNQNELAKILGDNSLILTAQLREVMRQSDGSPILLAAKACLNGIEHNKPYSNPSQLQHQFDVSYVIHRIADATNPLKIEPTVIALAPSNREVTALNTLVRRALGRCHEKLEPGDHLYLSQSIFDDGLRIQKGTAAIVTESRSSIIEWGNVRFQKVRLKYLIDSVSQEIWTLVNLDFLFSEKGCLSSELEKGLVAHVMTHNPRYRASKDIRDDKYLSAARTRFAYAMTVHKSQGREFDSVFIKPHWQKGQGDLDMFKFQYMYVAVTRAKKEAQTFNLYLPRVA